MRLAASVKRVVGKARYYKASISDGVVVPLEELPIPSRVEIEEDESGIFLYHYDADHKCIADDWFSTLADAKNFAHLQYGIGEDDWADLG